MIERKRLLRFIKTMFLCLCLGYLHIGCDAVKQIQFAKEINNSIELGNIVVREGTLRSNVEIKGSPLLNTQIRVSLVQRPFTKEGLAAYETTIYSQNLETSNRDSIQRPLFYYEIELIDDIGYAKLLNEDITSREYVKSSKNAGAITKLKMVPRINISSEGMTTVFLEIFSNNGQGIVLYEKDEPTLEIPFSEMIVFGYEVSYFCYGKDLRNQTVVMDLIEEGKSCKKPLVKKAHKLNKIKNLADY